MKNMFVVIVYLLTIAISIISFSCIPGHIQGDGYQHVFAGSIKANLKITFYRCSEYTEEYTAKAPPVGKKYIEFSFSISNISEHVDDVFLLKESAWEFSPYYNDFQILHSYSDFTTDGLKYCFHEDKIPLRPGEFITSRIVMVVDQSFKTKGKKLRYIYKSDLWGSSPSAWIDLN